MSGERVHFLSSRSRGGLSGREPYINRRRWNLMAGDGSRCGLPHTRGVGARVRPQGVCAMAPRGRRGGACSVLPRTPRSETECFTRLTREDGLLEVFEGVTAQLVVCGHTNMQFDRSLGRVRVVNAGSVGMPFGHTGADAQCDHPLAYDGTAPFVVRFAARTTHADGSMRTSI